MSCRRGQAFSRTAPFPPPGERTDRYNLALGNTHIRSNVLTSTDRWQLPVNIPTNFFPVVVTTLFFPTFSSSHSTPSHYSHQIRDLGSHSGPSSPRPTTVRAFILIARRTQHCLSLNGSRRTVPTHAARRSQQLIIFFAFLQILVKISPRWESISRTNASSIRG